METINNMRESHELDWDKLEYLRNETVLGPVAMYKVNRAKKLAENFRNIYQQYEGEVVSTDYSVADELEYEMRFNAYCNKLSKDWLQYGDGLGLQEFAENCMAQHINEARHK